MTEENLFRSTLVTLAVTLAAPLIVGLTGVGGPQNTSANDIVKSYVTASNQSNQTDSAKKADNSAKDTASNNNDTSTESKQDNDTATSDNTADKSQNSSATKADAKVAGTYTVMDGDTYGCIAEEYYGSYDQWQRVYDANAGWSGFNEYDLAVGAKLQMPAVAANEVLPATQLCK